MCHPPSIVWLRSWISSHWLRPLLFIKCSCVPSAHRTGLTWRNTSFLLSKQLVNIRARPSWNMTWPFARMQPPPIQPIGRRWTQTRTILMCGHQHPWPHDNYFSHHPAQALPHWQVRSAAPVINSWNQVPWVLPFVISTSASSVEDSTPGSTAPFLVHLALGDGSEPAGSLVVLNANSVSFASSFRRWAFS